MEEYQDVIEQLIAQKPTAIIAFGSRVWGEPHEDSDLDIVMIKDSNKPRIQRIREIRSSIDTRLPLDIIHLTQKEAETYRNKYSFYKQIFSKGQVLYGRI